MNKAKWVWPLWISIWSGIYGFIYLLTPLKEYGIMWMGFISLPIYFTGGAKKSELPNYIGSMVCGIFWGLANIWFTNLLIDAGLSVVLANTIDLVVVTVPLCWLHLNTLANTWFNKLPMVFGALALTLSTGGEKIVPMGITLAVGLCLGLIFNLGGSYFYEKYSKEVTELKA